MNSEAKILLVVGLFPVFFLYNNCSGPERKSSSSTNTSTTCKVGPSAVLKLKGFDSQYDCHDFTAIKCESRNFQPDIAEGVVEKEVCLSKNSTSCMTLTERTYDTASAGGEAEDYLPGGAYNYQEFNCYNSKFNLRGHPIIQSSAETLAEAMDALQNNCLAMGEQ